MAKPFSLEDQSIVGHVVSVYDGDSFKAEFPLPHPQFKLVSPTYKWTCRIIGIDTPELRSKNLDVRSLAYKARDRVRELVLGKDCRLELSEFDKYGRVLATLFTPEGEDVASILINEGLALSYDGGKKPDWGRQV